MYALSSSHLAVARHLRLRLPNSTLSFSLATTHFSPGLPNSTLSFNFPAPYFSPGIVNLALPLPHFDDRDVASGMQMGAGEGAEA